MRNCRPGTLLLLVIMASAFPRGASADECAIYNIYHPEGLRAGRSISIGVFGVDGIANYDAATIEALRVFAAEELKKELQKIDYFSSVTIVSDQATEQRDMHLDGVITGLEAAGSRWMRAVLGAGGAKARLRGVVRLSSGEVFLDYECEGDSVGGPFNLGGWVAALQSGDGRMRKNFENFASDFAKSFKDMDKVWRERQEKGVKARARSVGRTEKKNKKWRERVRDTWTPEEHSKEVATFVVQTENKDYFRVHAMWLTRSAYQSNAHLNRFDFDDETHDLEDGLLPDLSPIDALIDRPVYLIAVTFEGGASDGSTDGDEPPFFWNDGALVEATYLTRKAGLTNNVAAVEGVRLSPYLKRRGAFKVRWRNTPMVFAFPVTTKDGSPLLQSLSEEVELHTNLAGHDVLVRFRLSDFELPELRELLVKR